MPNSYHTKFEIKVIKLANSIDQVSDEKLFIRYYIPALGNRRVQVDTRQIQSKNSVMWNECASFESQANLDQIKKLELGHDITFELRSRRKGQIFGGIITKSRLLGGGEISWKDVMVSKEMEVEKWINFRAKNGKLDGIKLPNLLVKMKIQVTRGEDSNGMKRCGSKKECDWNESEIDLFHVETLID